jgi:hypothetical protein
MAAMAVRTLKSKGGKSADGGVLKAQAAACGLLDSCADRVLVVYDKRGANLYYEPTPAQAALRPGRS